MFFQHLIDGLTTGSVYALIALGYTMIYGILGLINFAQGEIEVREGLFSDKMTVPREFLQKLTHKLAQGIGVQPRVKLVEPGSLNREAETSPRVLDLRQ